jgi:hypothetical protein
MNACRKITKEDKARIQPIQQEKHHYNIIGMKVSLCKGESALEAA